MAIGAIAEGLTQGMREGRADARQLELSKKQDKVTDLKIEELESNAEFRRSQQAHRKALGQFIASEGADTAPMVDWFNKNMPGMSINDLTLNEDGSYRAELEDGREIKFKDKVHVAQASEYLMKPESWIEMHKAKPMALADGAQLVDANSGRVLVDNAKDAAGKPTGSHKKYKEMLALKVPENVARGVAYGTIKEIKDELGLSTALVDLSNNVTIGTLSTKGKEKVWQPNPEYLKPQAPNPAPGSAPAQPSAPAPAQPPAASPPPQAVEMIKQRAAQGQTTKFGNGTEWTIQNGQVVQVK